MSVIENALQKLRGRSGSPGVTGARLAAPRPPREPGSLVSSGAVSVNLVGSPEHALKRISVNLAALRVAGYLAAEGEQRRFADQYRQIKRPLIEKALAGGSPAIMRLVLVTSALPGDGKTFTTVNLALSMARERDLSVLLVDADLPRAHVSQIFGLSGEPGLMDALLDESIDVESLVVRTDIHGLDILPAGKFVENATELLASARMAQIIARISAHNPRRFALFDSSPLLGSSEADALVRLPGQIVLVVRASTTPRHAVLEALDRIDESKLQGLVLNQASAARTSGGYYGYYGYYGGRQQED